MTHEATTGDKVHRQELPDGTSVWLVGGYAEVRAGLADPRLSLDKRHARGYRGLSLPPALDANLLNMDPPQHTRIRALVSRAFTPRRVAGLRPQIQHLADTLLDAAEAGSGGGPVDLISGYAGPLPIGVISLLLGVPDGAVADLRGWTTTMLAPDGAQALRDAVAAVYRFLADLVADKRAHPRDDLLSALVAARDTEDRLTEDELTSLAFLLLFAGYENSVNLVGNATVALLRDPPTLARLRAEPNLLPATVEEMLRLDPPAPAAIRRFPTEDVTIAGTRIPAGETVLLSIAGANHDPARFTDPTRIDLDRVDNAHLSLGHGIHYCVGAPLARLEAEVALGTLLRRYPGLALAVAPDELRWRPSSRTRGLVDLPVLLR